MNDRFPARFALLFSWATAAFFGAATTPPDFPDDPVVQMKPPKVNHSRLWFSPW
jgi:hypothetical protein